jgi:hypothetical protein
MASVSVSRAISREWYSVTSDIGSEATMQPSRAITR